MRSVFFSILRDIVDKNHNVTIAGQNIDTHVLRRNKKIGIINDEGTHDLIKCPNCLHIAHIVGEPTNPSSFTMQTSIQIQPEKLHPGIPEIVRKDMAEAKSALAARLPNASAVMTRRTLQRICQDKGASGNTLFHQINSLLDSYPEMENLATEIRQVGNLGAHPDNTIQNDLTIQDAKNLDNFMDLFVRIIYEVPYEINQSRQNTNRQNS